MSGLLAWEGLHMFALCTRRCSCAVNWNSELQESELQQYSTAALRGDKTQWHM